jgi:tetratricopeptide (TPR) repeat protein
MACRVAGVLAFLLLVLGARPARADHGDISKHPINDENPSASIPSEDQRNANPIEFGFFLQDLFTKAELAFQAKEYEKSAKYFEALAKTLPDRALSFGMLCRAYENAGKIELAAANCGKALRLGGVMFIDHFRFVRVTLKKQTLSAVDAADIDASIAHVRQQLGALPPEPEVPPPPQANRPKDRKPTANEIMADVARIKEEAQLRREVTEFNRQRAEYVNELSVLACRLGLRLRDAARLGKCLDELRGLKADERVLLTFDWSRALVLKDRAHANALLERAKRLKLPAATLSAMHAEQAKAFAPTGLRAFVERFGLLLLLGALLLASAPLVYLKLRRRELKPADQRA